MVRFGLIASLAVGACSFLFGCEELGLSSGDGGDDTEEASRDESDGGKKKKKKAKKAKSSGEDTSAKAKKKKKKKKKSPAKPPPGGWGIGSRDLSRVSRTSLEQAADAAGWEVVLVDHGREMANATMTLVHLSDDEERASIVFYDFGAVSEKDRRPSVARVGTKKALLVELQPAPAAALKSARQFSDQLLDGRSVDQHDRASLEQSLLDLTWKATDSYQSPNLHVQIQHADLQGETEREMSFVSIHLYDFSEAYDLGKATADKTRILVVDVEDDDDAARALLQRLLR